MFVMKDTQFPTFADVRTAEIRARELRAEVLRDGTAAFFAGMKIRFAHLRQVVWPRLAA